MKYEVLIAHLRECAKLDPIENTYAEAADAIEELNILANNGEATYEIMVRQTSYIEKLKQKIPHWIPVTERLPESVCKSYLCLTDTGYHCEVRWTNNVYGLFKSDDEWGWSIVDVPQYCKVTHWMPLPEPPKDGE